MDPPPRPKLSLKFSVGGGAGGLTGSPATAAIHSAPPSQPATPNVRAPQRSSSVTSLKLSLKPNTGSASASQPATPANERPTPTGSTKKRKRETGTDEGEGEAATRNVQKIKAPKLLKLITKTGLKGSSQPASAITPGIKLKTKGKIPKRPPGVGYDSELDDREVDPVILEAFVLRMLPGDDCNYIRDAITNGTVGVSVLQKGADIRMRFLDVNGRRGILLVRGKQYAFSIVDLPTVTEGMKSWDRKNFIKSIDVSQMCLVLGRCNTDEEARNYPLPPDVNPKNFQYAHGLTAPMKNVRKRRFERTVRARLDDIESVERKVNAHLEADGKATKSEYDLLSYDPRRESEDADAGSDDDAEAEDDDYFGVDAEADPDESMFDDVQLAEQPDVDIEDLEAMFEDDSQEPRTAEESATGGQSVAADSDSVAPSPAAFDTPADTPATGTEDANADYDDDADNDNDDEDEDDDEEQQEANTEKAAVLTKIKEVEQRKAQLLDQLSKATSPPLKRKIAKKIQEIESDLGMLRRHAGIKVAAVDEGDEEEGEALGVTVGAESEEE